ncbi:2,3-butanediol dehydrogenase [Cryobacterium sp. MDB1-18-2]|uniref:2,3-butanediol dehydrogenase n=1 Tax=unclassified Cryobacterium TaxID=2649013 RepID=UPI0010693117|nr:MULTISPECIES: 2,3-butanediol dehydrogenase [unclassified Cryobacterium]TFC33764.1 2,3-butanediol dehydrogenase [Cryobacterium sp. MDB1-18-2]TFC40736.1 2,3-butanediol dehydrogenase [Cryobacterium sp. MDB1-18-1]
MRAAVFHGAGDIRVEEVTAPESPRAGEILVRPLWCGICGTDLHEYAQGPIVIPREPHPLTGACGSQILGHEFSAEVVEVGEGVTAVRPGERVSVMPLLSCGHCYFCRRGLNHLCRTMAAVGLSYQWGGIADLAIVPAANVTVLPDGVSDLQGAVVEPGAVAAYGVDTARVRPGDNVLITGAGPIGALASLYAASLGANVFVSEVNPVRAALVRSFDVGVVLDPTAVDVPGWLRDRTDGIGVDAVIECSGNERALQAAIASVRSAGRISQTGLHTKAAAIDPMVISEHDITISGTWCFPVTDWPRIIDLIDRGRYPVEKVVTAQIAMKDVVAQGFDTLLSPTGDQVKVLVRAGS